MFTETDLNDRLVIIQNASLDDAAILAEKYKAMIAEASNYEERYQFLSLKENVLTRINELTQKSR